MAASASQPAGADGSTVAPATWPSASSMRAAAATSAASRPICLSAATPPPSVLAQPAARPRRRRSHRPCRRRTGASCEPARCCSYTAGRPRLCAKIAHRDRTPRSHAKIARQDRTSRSHVKVACQDHSARDRRRSYPRPCARLPDECRWQRAGHPSATLRRRPQHAVATTGPWLVHRSCRPRPAAASTGP